MPIVIRRAPVQSHYIGRFLLEIPFVSPGSWGCQCHCHCHCHFHWHFHSHAKAKSDSVVKQSAQSMQIMFTYAKRVCHIRRALFIYNYTHAWSVHVKSSVSPSNLHCSGKLLTIEPTSLNGLFKGVQMIVEIFFADPKKRQSSAEWHASLRWCAALIYEYLAKWIGNLVVNRAWEIIICIKSGFRNGLTGPQKVVK